MVVNVQKEERERVCVYVCAVIVSVILTSVFRGTVVSFFYAAFSPQLNFIQGGFNLLFRLPSEVKMR